MIICMLFGHKYHLEEKSGFLFRWCARCGQAHTLDKVVQYGSLKRLEWDSVHKKNQRSKGV
jgi:hypothetical protein